MSASADAPAVAGGVDAQRALSERAAALIELGRHREALPLLQRLIAQAPDHHYAHCLLASVFSGLDQPKQALEYAERAIHLDPQEPWAYYKRGLLLLDAGRKREALPALEQAVKLAPQDCDYLHALAVGQIVRGKTKLAAQAAERMAALAPDAALTHTTLARVKIIQKRWQEAEVHAKTAVRIDPGSASALAFLGLAIIMQRGREREGLDLIHRAIKLSPNDKIAKIALQEGMKIYLPKPSALGLLIAFAAPGVLVWLAIRYVIDTALHRRRLKSLPEELKLFARQSRTGWGSALRILTVVSLVTGVGGLLALTQNPPATRSEWLVDIALCVVLLVFAGYAMMRLRRKTKDNRG